MSAARTRELVMSKYGKGDAAKDTGSSSKSTRSAWHDARDHAAGSGHLSERNKNKVRDSENGSILGGFFDAIFGSDRSGYREHKKGGSGRSDH